MYIDIDIHMFKIPKLGLNKLIYVSSIAIHIINIVTRHKAQDR
jgi:hypothetical protein